MYLFCDNCIFRFRCAENADLRVFLTFGLCDDMTHSQSLTDTVEGLVPGIAPLINIIVRARPDHVVHCIITGT